MTINDNLISENIKGKILWTNPNPNNEIQGTMTINLSSDDYDMLEVLFKVSTNSAHYFADSCKIVKGGCGTISTGNYGNKGRGIYWRELVRVNDTKYTLSAGNYYATNGSGSDSHSCCIPMYIIGYKTGLFN